MNATLIGMMITGFTSIAVGAVGGWFAWRNRDTEVTAPDRMNEAWAGLVNGLREEIQRLEVRQTAADLRIARLEQRAIDDEQTINFLQRQIEWLLSRLRREDIEEFHRLFDVE